MAYTADYLLELSTTENIEKQVKLYKLSCAKHIGRFRGMHSQTHISFAIIGDKSDKHLQPSHRMEIYFEQIARVLKTFEPHSIYIKGFNFFSHGPKFRTIYAAIELNEDTRKWLNKIDTILNLNMNTMPHITIAKNIPVASFNILWPFFQKLNYEDSFVADKLTILQKDPGNSYSIYRPFIEIPFNGRQSLLETA
jgi:2'-5' RNA ligase